MWMVPISPVPCQPSYSAVRLGWRERDVMKKKTTGWPGPVMNTVMLGGGGARRGSSSPRSPAVQVKRHYHAKVSKVASPAKEARRRRRNAHARAPWKFTAHELPSLGRGEDPSSSDGGRNPQPQQPGRDAPRHGPASPVRGSRADVTARTAPPHSRRPWAATGCFTRGWRSTPRLRTGPATASNGWPGLGPVLKWGILGLRGASP